MTLGFDSSVICSTGASASGCMGGFSVLNHLGPLCPTATPGYRCTTVWGCRAARAQALQLRSTSVEAVRGGMVVVALLPLPRFPWRASAIRAVFLIIVFAYRIAPDEVLRWERAVLSRLYLCNKYRRRGLLIHKNCRAWAISTVAMGLNWLDCP